VVAGFGALNSGCAFHSETRDKQGSELKAAWAKVDVGAQVAAYRANQAGILDEHLKLEDTIWNHHKSRLASQMVTSGKVGELKVHLKTRLAEVAGDEKQRVEYKKHLDAAKAAEDGLERSIRNIRLAGATWPGCDATIAGPTREAFLESIKALKPEERAIGARNSLDLTVEDCKKRAAAEAGIAASGELGKARVAHAKEREKLASAEREVDAAKVEAKAAAAAYEELSATLNTAAPSSKEEVDKAAGRLRTALQMLASLQSAVGQEFVAAARLDGINGFLTTYDDVVAGKGAAEGSSKTAMALALFPDLSDKAKAAIQDAQKPRLLPLVMEKKVEQAKLEAAQRNVARQKKALELRAAQVDVLEESVKTLTSAEKSLAALSGVQDSEALGPLLMPLKVAPLDMPTQEEKQRTAQRDALAELARKQELWRLAGRVLYAEGRLRADVNKLRHQITALGFEEPISYAESGLMQWKALLDPSVELLADYGASGLKAKDIQDVLNSLSLLWIAAKVK